MPEQNMPEEELAEKEPGLEMYEEPLEESPKPDFLRRRIRTKYPMEKPRKKHWLLYIILALVLIFVFVYGAKLYSLVKWSQSHVNVDPTTLQPRKTGLLQTIKGLFFNSEGLNGDERVNILILGVGGPGHEGPFLSDTNIILSIKPSEKKAALISIPRDLSAKVGEYGYKKINNASAFGEMKQPGAGGEYARQIFAETFNMDIPYYVRFDFQAFVDLVDAVGGIDINVSRTFTDYSYPAANYAYQTVSFTAGPEHMAGARALMFARSRHGNNGEGSDFARAKRQQMVITALKEKFLSAGTFLNPITAQKIIDSLTAHIATNLNFGQIMYLADLAKDISGTETKTLVLDDSPGSFLRNTISPEGAFLLVPKTGDFSLINAAIANVFEATSTISFTQAAVSHSAAAIPTFPSVKIEIQNGTWKVGYAARIKQELIDKGFNITAIGNSAIRPVATSSIYILNQKADKDVRNSLTAAMGIVPTINLPAWLTTASASGTPKYRQDTDILIVLGENN